MRIVAVTNQFPLPLDAGGPLRFYGLSRALAQDHDVHLLARSREGTTPELVERMSDVIGGPVEVFEPSPTPGFAGRWARALRTGVPTYVQAQYSDELAARLRELAAGADAVALLDDYAAAYGRTVGDVAPVVVDKSNILGWSIQDSTPAPGLRGRALHAISKSLVRRFERDCLEPAAAVTVTSPEEGERMQELYGRAAAAVVPSGVDVPPSPVELPATRTVGWLGEHGYAPNVDGLVRFVEEAWEPLGRDGCRLVVPGRNPPAEVRALERHPGVEVVGFVEDLDELFSGLSAAVVPLWRGAGVKLKTLTFMAAGIPVVGTPVALEGVEARDGRDCIVRSEPRGLAEGLQGLLLDGDAAAAIGAAGRRLVEDSYTWGALGSRFVEVVERVARTLS